MAARLVRRAATRLMAGRYARLMAGRYAAHGEPLRGTRIRYPPKARFMKPSRGGRVEVNVDVPVEKRPRESEWRLVAAAAVDRSRGTIWFMAINYPL